MPTRIKCSKDAAGWFDELSILNVKLNLSSGEPHETALKNHAVLGVEIEEALGISLFHRIISSDEYKELYEANKTVFEAVELAKADKILASEVDRLNYQRYVVKQNLQKKFFNDKLTEVKLGY